MEQKCCVTVICHICLCVKTAVESAVRKSRRQISNRHSDSLNQIIGFQFEL